MPFLKKLNFLEPSGANRQVYFLPKSLPTAGGTATVITGKNGSQKSRVLSEIVSGIFTPREDLSVDLHYGTRKESFPVICVSATTADRFPQKEVAGRPTEYDISNYIYVGQRVGANLLSKKKPLEALISFALDPAVRERFSWDFFSSAFAFAGVHPELKVEISIRDSKAKKEAFQSFGSLRGYMQNLVQQGSTARSSGRSLVTPATAERLIEDFTVEDFRALTDFVNRKIKRVDLVLSKNGIMAENVPLDAIWLGLLSNSVTVNIANVTSLKSGEEFSVFDLSSGEFHMLTTILALGFSTRDDALILIDEPENSLHPQWQIDFMRVTQSIFSKFEGYHVIISTHSPLIVNSATEGTHIVDMDQASFQEAVGQTNFGANSDHVLFERFGIASSRNPYVSELVQRAVSLTELGAEGEKELVKMSGELRAVRTKLPKLDPLREIITALIE